MTIFKFALLRGLRSPLSLILNFAAPVALVFIRNFWQDGGEGGLTGGFMLLGALIMFGAFAAARGIFNDRTDGTVTRILSGPTTTLRYLAQNLLACMVMMFIPIGVIVSVGAILHGWEISLAIWLFLCYTIFAAASVAFCFAWSCLFKTKETSSALFSLAAMFMGYLGGLLLPAQFLPRALNLIGAAFPPFWIARALENLLSYGATTQYWLSLLALVLFTVAFMLYGGKRRII